MTDSERIQSRSQTDVLDLVFQPEVKEFIETTIQSIPKITTMMKIASKMYDLAEESMKDGGMLESLEHATRDKADPIQDKIEDGMSLVEEARERGLVPLFVDFRDGLFLRFTQSWMILPDVARGAHICVMLS